MAHVAKFKLPALGHILLHYERGLDSEGKPIKFKNQSIDLTRSHLNRNLCKERDMTQLDYVHSLIDKYCQRKRKDMVALISTVITLPKNVKKEHSDEFFESVHKALTDLFLNGNEEFIVSSYIHRDEKSEHLHYNFCPIIFDRKKDKYKFCAKEVVNRNNLQKLHPYLEKEITKAFEKYGYVPQIITGEMSTTHRSNLSIEKYKEFATLRTAIAQSKEELCRVEKRHHEIEQKLHSLNIEYIPKKAYLENLNKLHSDAEVKENKNIFTGQTNSVTIPIDIWNSQKILYADYSAAKAMRKTLEKKIVEIQQYLKDNCDFDYELKIKELNEELEEMKIKNKELEFAINQVKKVFSENPALKSEYDLTVQWLNNKISSFQPEFRERFIQ